MFIFKSTITFTLFILFSYLEPNTVTDYDKSTDIQNHQYIKLKYLNEIWKYRHLFWTLCL